MKSSSGAPSSPPLVPAPAGVATGIIHDETLPDLALARREAAGNRVGMHVVALGSSCGGFVSFSTSAVLLSQGPPALHRATSEGTVMFAEDTLITLFL
mmetsp:Transcript_39447/g.39890  ORF Transcript_39447/g.39890 Transcript_39447/m.39890 type:complete len:98 (-) Transcript_39447:509-802(-)